LPNNWYYFLNVSAYFRSLIILFMKFKNILPLLIALLISGQTFAQRKSKKEKAPADPNRAEVTIEGYDQAFNVITLDTNGLLLCYQDADKKYQIVRYTNDFKKVFQVAAPADEKMYFLKNTYDEDGKVYLFFGAIKYMSVTPAIKEYTIIQLDPLTKKMIAVNGEFEKNFYYTDFTASGGQTFIYGNSTISTGKMALRVCLTVAGLGIPAIFGSLRFPSWPTVCGVNFKKKSPTTEIMYDYGKKSRAYIVAADMNPATKKTHLLIKHQVSRKKLRMYMRDVSYDPMASFKIGDEIELDVPQRKELFEFKINNINDRQKLLMGTYGKIKTKFIIKYAGFSIGYVNGKPYAHIHLPSAFIDYQATEGIYFSKLSGKKQDYTSLFILNDLKGYMKFKYTKKNSKKPVKIPKVTTTDRKFLLHNIIEDENQYIMVGETYFPTYAVKWYCDASGKNCEPYIVFDGWQYEACEVMGISKDGKKVLWDDAFKLGYYKTWVPTTELVTVLPYGDDLYFTYFDGAQIIRRKLDGDHLVQEGVDNEKLKGKKKDKDLTTGYSFPNVKHWYEDVFVIYGYGEKTTTTSKDSKSTTKKKKRKKRREKTTPTIVMEKIKLDNSKVEEDED
jgi:hypothetical protein